MKYLLFILFPLCLNAQTDAQTIQLIDGAKAYSNTYLNFNPPFFTRASNGDTITFCFIYHENAGTPIDIVRINLSKGTTTTKTLTVPIPQPPTDYFITLNDIDTTTKLNNQDLLVIGYPASKVTPTNLLPSPYIVKAVKSSGALELRLDTNLEGGTSGSPIYYKNPKNNSIKIVAICSHSGAKTEDYKSFGCPITYLTDLLRANQANIQLMSRDK